MAQTAVQLRRLRVSESLEWGEHANAANDAGGVREWLARELHDAVVQTLTVMVVELESLRRIETCDMTRRELGRQREAARSAIGELRRVVGELRGHEAERQDLADALADLVDRFGHDTGIDARLVIAPGWPSHLPDTIVRNLYAIVEQALINIRLHSGARFAEVWLQSTSAGLLVRIQDDGRGPGLGMAREGTGLLGMRERALLIGGCVSISAGERGGTTVVATVPLLAEGAA
jgi:two-component system, NarL family, sensor histidine kinase UhpB